MKVMQTRVGKVIASIILSAMVMVLVCTSVEPMGSDKDQAWADADKVLLYDLFSTGKSARQELLDSGCYNVTATLASLKYLNNSNNYNQDKLRENYNYAQGLNFARQISVGTCWATSDVIALKYYGAKATPQEINDRVIAQAFYLGYNPKKGLQLYNNLNVMASAAPFFGKSLLGTSEKKNEAKGLDVYSLVKKGVDEQIVSLVRIPGHEMIGCGYVSWKVNFQTRSLLNSKLFLTTYANYVVVNDTWADNDERQFSFCPANFDDDEFRAVKLYMSDLTSRNSGIRGENTSRTGSTSSTSRTSGR